MSSRTCTNCVNCDAVRGFMCTCHYSYDFVDENGESWHRQVGQDVNIKRANKCEQYMEMPYDRDQLFVL